MLAYRILAPSGSVPATGWIAACAAMTRAEAGVTEQGQRRLVFVEGVVVEEGFEGGLGFGG